MRVKCMYCGTSGTPDKTMEWTHSAEKRVTDWACVDATTCIRAGRKRLRSKAKASNLG